ncbi:MAG: oligosaccharide flippase family protein [Desulfobacterales bacterium]|nr:oligosaccharide flippase family protein [Desulfobacterales bacterium]
MRRLLSNKVVTNILANQSGFLVTVVVTLLLSPFVVHSLGDARYGIWSLIVSFTGHYGLLAFGLQGAVVRYISHAVALKDYDKASGYMSIAFVCLAVTAVLCVVIGYGLSGIVSGFFNFPPPAGDDAGTAFFLVSLTAAATFLSAVFQCNLFAHQKFALMNGIGVAGTLVRAVMTVILLNAGYGILGLAVLGLGISLFLGLLQVMASFRYCNRVRIRLSGLKPENFNDLIRFGSKSFLFTLSTALVYQCDLLVIGRFLSAELITIYTLAATLVTYLIQCVTVTNNAMTPHATGIFARDGINGLSGFYGKTAYLMYMFGGLVFAGCFVLGPSFYQLWVGEGYAESGTLLYILLIPQFFATGYGVCHICMSALGTPGRIAVFASVEGVLNLILSILLVRSFGIYGVAAGTLIPQILHRGIIGPAYCGRRLGFGPGTYFRAVAWGIFICGVGTVAGLWVSAMLPPVTWFRFCANVLAILLACGTAGFTVFRVKQRTPYSAREVE